MADSDEATGSRHVFSLLHYLNKTDAHSYKYFINELFAIFYAIDVTICPRIRDWLRPVYGWKDSEEIVQKALRKWVFSTLPLQFEEQKKHGFVVTSRSGGSTLSENDGGDGGDTDSDNEDDRDSNFIHEVSACTTDQSVHGFILATIREGDQIKLNSHSLVWWTVHEMRVRKKTVLLSQQRSRISNNNEEEGLGDGDRDGDEDVGANDFEEDGEEEAKRKLTIHKKKTPPREYKEVYLESLIGALVQREGMITAKSFESLEREPECDFDNNLMTFEEAEEYNALMMTSKGGSTLAKKQSDSKGKGGKGKEKVEYEDRRVSVFFKMPSPDPKAALDKMKLIVKEFPKIDDSMLVKTKQGSILKDPLWHAQHQAQIQVWVNRWEENLRAKELLVRIDPYLCLNQEKWLLICKILRVISRGSETLLQNFIEWTKCAGKDGISKESNARQAWHSVRPVTTCDLSSLSNARGYLHSRGAGHKKSYFDKQGKLRPESMEADPLARVVLDAVAMYCNSRVLTFFDQSLLVNDLDTLVESQGGIDQAAVNVSAAIYSFQAQLSSHGAEGDFGEGHKLDTEDHLIGHYTSTENIAGYITINDCLLIRGPLIGLSENVKSDSVKWVYVTAVDLLFARLRVAPCEEDKAPPYAWNIDHIQSIVAKKQYWIPISRLWDVTVGRQLVSNVQELENGIGKYLIFVTPMPSSKECLAMLGHLSTEDASGRNKKIGGFKEYKNEAYVDEVGKENDSKKFLLKKKKNIKENKNKTQSEDIKKVSSLDNYRKARKGKLSAEVVRFYTDSVIVKWECIFDTNQLFLKKMFPEKDKEVEVLLEITPVDQPTAWKNVYQGVGVACQISGLDSLIKYYCRISCISHPAVKRNVIILEALGVPPSTCPRYIKWEEASVKTNIRYLIEIDSLSETEKEISKKKLPSGCYYLIEGSVGDGENIENEEMGHEESEKEWIPLARSKNRQAWVVGPFKTTSLILRVRTINSAGQRGPPGPSLCLEQREKE